jgi:hypothetical protein
MPYKPSIGDHTAFGTDFFHDDVTMPNNTSANGTVMDIGRGSANGGIAIVGIVSANIALADTKVLSFKVQDSANGTDFTGGLDITVYSRTASGATTLTKSQAQGKELWRYILPQTSRRFVRVVATTTDTQQSGKFTVFPVTVV